MPEGIMTPDGLPVDIADKEREFNAAMGATVQDVPAPPKKAPPKPESESPAPKARRGRPPKSDRARVTAGVSAPPKADPAVDKKRSDGIKGIVQMAAGCCLVADSRTPDFDIAFKADAVVLANSAEPLADALTEIARHNVSFAAVLDRVTASGPYAALVAVTIGLASQIARNHGVKAGEMLGAKSPEDVLASLEVEESVSPPATP